MVSDPGSGAPGDTLTFTVVVKENGAAAPDQAVTFSITSGDENASLGTEDTTTGTNGQAQTTLILGDNASGSYTITATSNSVSTTGIATVQTSPPPSTFTIEVVSDPGSGAPGDTLTFTVVVKEDGAAAPDQTVDFSITSGDANASLGTPNPATTGNDGQAGIELTLGDSASGSYTITATSNSVSTTGIATVQTSPPPSTFTIEVVSDPGSGAPGDTLTFTVVVKENGAAAPDQAVTFSITSGDENASLGTEDTTTGTNGQAQTTLILGSNASGSYAITATSQGQSVSGTATVTSGDGNGNGNGNGNGDGGTMAEITGETMVVETIKNRTYRKETNLSLTKTLALCLHYPSMPGGTLFISPLKLRR